MSTEYEPSPAERARTVLACAAVPTIDIAGRVAEDVAVHATNADGALVLLAPTAGVLGERAACRPAVAACTPPGCCPPPCGPSTAARASPTAASATPDPTPASPRFHDASPRIRRSDLPCRALHHRPGGASR